MVEPLKPYDNIIWRMRIALWITEATETHSEYFTMLLYRYYLQIYLKLCPYNSPKYLHSQVKTRTYFGGGPHHHQGRQFHGQKTPLFKGCLSCHAHTDLYRGSFYTQLVHVTLPTYVLNSYMCIVKGKAIPLQAWRGPEDSRRLRIRDFKTICTRRW